MYTTTLPSDRITGLERRRRILILAKATEQRNRLADAIEAAKSLGRYADVVALGAMHTTLELAIKTGNIYRSAEEGHKL